MTKLYGQTPTIPPATEAQRAQWALDERWDNRHKDRPSWTVSVRRQFVNADEFHRVTVRDNETGEETVRDYPPNLITASEAALDAFTYAVGEANWLGAK